VPSDAPKLVTVFCSPPTSALSESGTAATVSGTELRGKRPDPKPHQQHGKQHDARSRVRRDAADETEDPRGHGEESGTHHATCGEAREEPRDADRRHQQGERERSSLAPVWTALSPRTTDR